MAMAGGTRCLLLCIVLGIVLQGFLVQPSYADQTVTTQKPPKPKPTDTDDPKERANNPRWIWFAIIVFVIVTLTALAVSLTVGIIKYRRYHKKHGLYKSRSAVEGASEEGTTTQDYGMFVVDTQLLSSPGGSSERSNSPEAWGPTSPNATYIGSS